MNQVIPILKPTAHLKLLVQYSARLAVVSLAFFWLYFHHYSAEIDTFSVICGAARLQSPQVVYVEIEPGILMMRHEDLIVGSGGIGSAFTYPCNPDLEALGWDFQDQMGAFLTYGNGYEFLHVSHRSCGDHYFLAVLDKDPATGAVYYRRTGSR